MAPSIQELIATLDRVGAEASAALALGSNEERLALINALLRAQHRLQTPFERAWKLTMADPNVYAAIKTTMDLGLWKAWRADGGFARTVDELAGLCEPRCSTNLLLRLLRLLAADHVVQQTGPATFQTNAFSDALGTQAMHLTMRCGASTWMPAAGNMPAHLAAIDYAEPTDAADTAYTSMASNVARLPFFANCKARPDVQADFFACMSGITDWKQDWTEYFGTSHLVKAEAEAEAEDGRNGAGVEGAPLWVDVGGNAGIDAMRVLKKHPKLPEGAVVLQDVPGVVALAKKNIDPRITAMAHDFFTPQPVLHARVYFLHSILHDWPDALALQLLGHLRQAFKRGWSRLVIVDVVVPAQQASLMQAAHDVLLMGLLAAMERTEADWRKLLRAAGFRVIKCWPDSKGVESVIEAELADDADDAANAAPAALGAGVAVAVNGKP